MVRSFNPEKELRKIQGNKREKILLVIIFLLIIITIGTSFALYQVQNKQDIVFTKVGNFYDDYIIAAYVDGKMSTDFPSENSNYVVEKIECTNGATGIWDYTKWEIKISKLENSNTKCNVYFIKDETLPSEPELYQGMIPVIFDEDGRVKVADTSIPQKWYSYKNHMWANAVLVDCRIENIKNKYFDGVKLRTDIVGNEIPMEDILQMYVWIPRYKYKLWNAENGTSDEQAIEIAFESKDTPKSNGNTNGTWLTHPAFTFGDTELNGIWVGKFEPSNGTLSNSYDLTNIQIKPNVVSMVYINISEAFYGTRNIELQYASRYNINQNEIDTHMMKNMEWGAVAYLTNSKYGRYKIDGENCIDSGCEVWLNNTNTGTGCDGVSIEACGGAITGCSGDSTVSASINNTLTCLSGYDWAHKGVNASTTGTMYGIYDMVGGTWELIMSTMYDQNNNFFPVSSGFTSAPDSKYYDSYSYGENGREFTRAKLGDATKEVIKIPREPSVSWYNDAITFFYSYGAWGSRGGANFAVKGNPNAGIFHFNAYTGARVANASFRNVLTAQDN